MKTADSPFAEYFLDLQCLNVWAFRDLFEGMGKSLMKLYETKEQQNADEVTDVLYTVAKKHIYLEFPRLDLRERQ